MKFESRLKALETRRDACDPGLADRIEQARARVDAYDRERGIVRPPREPMVFPADAVTLAAQLLFARAEHARRAGAR